jgi:hypothetical protein
MTASAVRSRQGYVSYSSRYSCLSLSLSLSLSTPSRTGHTESRPTFPLCRPAPSVLISPPPGTHPSQRRLKRRPTVSMTFSELSPPPALNTGLPRNESGRQERVDQTISRINRICFQCPKDNNCCR